MDSNIYIRVWKDLDLEDINNHLLIAGDPQGDCSTCKEVGLNIQSVSTCPKCGTAFKYIASRVGSGASQAKKLKIKRPDLIAIDLSDFKEAMARKKAHKFLE